jgi:predicted lysophospholipase L1 biosynthesis ABC-type transport system permease subunit
MAELVLGVATSHSPLLSTPPEHWDLRTKADRANLQHHFRGDLPAPSLLPVVTGTLTGLIALLGFALPPLIQLKNVSPARVLRRDLGNDHMPAAIYIDS